MPKIIVTSRYIKPNAHKKFGNYIKYVATREGVEKPMSKHENNRQLDREIFINYLDSRPNSHGLFSEKDEPIVLDKAAKEVANHNGAIWTHIVSLKREDAERMGYIDLEHWRDLVRRHASNIAAAQKISDDNFRWYAAFHNKESNPHVHIVVFSKDGKQGYLTKEGIEKIRSAFANDIYRDELSNLYHQQTVVRDILRSEAENVMTNLLTELQNNIDFDSQLEQLILKLQSQLKNSKGKKIYGYLQPNVKKTVAERLRDIFRENGCENIFRMTSRNKDWNEDLKELHGLTPIPASAHLRKELFSENVSQLEFTSINLSRVTDSLNAASNRNKYADISNIALSASAEILTKVNEKPAEDMFENLRKHLLKEYRAYSDRGKIFSKTDTLKKSHFEVIKQLKNYPATKEQMKNIAKSLFDLADSALKCSTEQQMSEQQEQEEVPQQVVEIKMSM